MSQLRAGFKERNIAHVIQSMLKENGIEAYKQSIGKNSTTRQEENIYGIVRAPRTASTESIILVAPLFARVQNQSNPLKANLYGNSTRSYSFQRRPCFRYRTHIGDRFRSSSQAVHGQGYHSSLSRRSRARHACLARRLLRHRSRFVTSRCPRWSNCAIRTPLPHRCTTSTLIYRTVSTLSH